VWRTALREAEKRRQSPSSAQITAAVTGPTPYCALQCLAGRLAAGERGDLPTQRIQLGLNGVHDAQRGKHRLVALYRARIRDTGL
jgi:hypothetical protein